MDGEIHGARETGEEQQGLQSDEAHVNEQLEQQEKQQIDGVGSKQPVRLPMLLPRPMRSTVRCWLIATRRLRSWRGRSLRRRTLWSLQCPRQEDRRAEGGHGYRARGVRTETGEVPLGP